MAFCGTKIECNKRVIFNNAHTCNIQHTNGNGMLKTSFVKPQLLKMEPVLSFFRFKRNDFLFLNLVGKKEHIELEHTYSSVKMGKGFC